MGVRDRTGRYPRAGERVSGVDTSADEGYGNVERGAIIRWSHAGGRSAHPERSRSRSRRFRGGGRRPARGRGAGPRPPQGGGCRCRGGPGGRRGCRRGRRRRPGR
ncbi:hypothetical protein C5D25_17750, partial [Rathayibacter sp. AY1D7]